MIVEIIAVVILSYLLGSINSSILIGRFYGKDIRKFGSGNAGLTNTVRVLGKKAAIFVLIGDVLKGVAACLLSSVIIQEPSFEPYILGGLFAIIGHNWPLYFGFRGGKGALTAVAIAFMIDPFTAALLLIVFITVLLVFRYVSLATITTGVFYPVLSFLITNDIYILVYSALITIIIIYKHRSNIKRLISKEEPTIDLKTKKG